MEEKEKVSKNFIEMAIDKDLEEGVYDHVMTRFPESASSTACIHSLEGTRSRYGYVSVFLS